MTIPTGNNVSLHELECDVKTELTEAETRRPQEADAEVPIDEWLTDPTDDQRYEVGLRTLYSAVKTLEDDSRPGDEAQQTEDGSMS